MLETSKHVVQSQRYTETLHWVPEDIFCLSILIVPGEAASTISREQARNGESKKLHVQTVSVFRTDLWSQGAETHKPDNFFFQNSFESDPFWVN